ncbi:LysM peptidoglycan-binding domain-containing protein [Alkalihalobacterium elongatum]|uniref:LysM peptidoglycan-binding domain-containing protein n=1 Tax=Alkalihalobacterium elongatum TaxID=2675466 RepID=UPI001C1F4716|nr:LysM domain-containing protein [Alkalihalobacterium elongatum]
MRTHHCQAGETLYVLADQYKVDLDMLLDLNKHIQDPTNIMQGTQVLIPDSTMGGMIPEINAGKGNVCAYVPEEPVEYVKLQYTQWPSQDYAVGYGSHTTLTPGYYGWETIHQRVAQESSSSNERQAETQQPYEGQINNQQYQNPYQYGNQAPVGYTYPTWTGQFYNQQRYY